MPKRKDVKKVVEDYFKDNSIKNLMDFGASCDEGLRDISKPFAEVLKSLGFKFEQSYAEDGSSDGKYNIFLEVPGITEERIELEVKAWYDVEQVTNEICNLLEDYDLLSDDDNKFEVLVALIREDGSYVNDSDIQIGFYDSFEEAKAICDKMDFQTPSMYEVYINEYDKNDEFVSDIRIH